MVKIVELKKDISGGEIRTEAGLFIGKCPKGRGGEAEKVIRVLLVKSPKTAGIECFAARGPIVQLSPPRPNDNVSMSVIHHEPLCRLLDLQPKVRLIAHEGDPDVADAD